MGLFATDWKIQVEKIQAPVYRVGALLDFIRAAASQLNVNSVLLDTFDTTVRKQAVWNGQKIVLQAALNDYFGLAANTIYITTTTALLTGYSYNEAESIHLFTYGEGEISHTYLFNEGELTSTYNFTVFIPVGIYTTEMIRRVKAVVNIYKIVGVTFTTASY